MYLYICIYAGLLKSLQDKDSNLFSALYGYFLASVSAKLEVSPGMEFRAAYEEAKLLVPKAQVCVAVCCSVLQCVAVCCRIMQLLHAWSFSVPMMRPSCSVPKHRCVLRCVAVCCSVLQCVAVCCSVVQCGAVCCCALQGVAVCCSVLQCVAVCCCVLLCVAVCCCVL